MRIFDLVEMAFLEGFRKGLEEYAHWKDGQQLVGTTGVRLSEAQRLAAETAHQHFLSFMNRQAGTWAVRDEVDSGSKSS